MMLGSEHSVRNMFHDEYRSKLTVYFMVNGMTPQATTAKNMRVMIYAASYSYLLIYRESLGSQILEEDERSVGGGEGAKIHIVYSTREWFTRFLQKGIKLSTTTNKK